MGVLQKRISIFIGPADQNGNIPMDYVHTEAVDLSGFGRRKATRVSHIRLDEETQEWVATLLDGAEIARHRLRSRVVAQEACVIANMVDRGEQVPGGPRIAK